MDYVTVGAVATGAVVLAWPKIAGAFSWLTAKPTMVGGSVFLPNANPNPGYHKWDAVELDALNYAVSKLPPDTTIGEFAGAVVVGEDYRDTIVSLLAGAKKAKVSK